VKESKQVVIYGNSVILGTIEASLKLCSGLEVTTLPQKEPQSLDALNPDILVFDLDATQPQEVFSLFANRPCHAADWYQSGCQPGPGMVRPANPGAVDAGSARSDKKRDGFVCSTKN
jgi:hypothetical protein